MNGFARGPDKVQKCRNCPQVIKAQLYGIKRSEPTPYTYQAGAWIKSIDLFGSFQNMSQDMHSSDPQQCV